MGLEMAVGLALALVALAALALELGEGQEMAWDHHLPKPGTR